MRRSLLALTAAAAALLAAPALASANDLTVTTGPSDGVGKTLGAATATYWPTKPGATLSVSELATDLSTRTQVRFVGYSGSSGTPADLTIAAPLTLPNAMVSVEGSVADLTVRANVTGAPNVALAPGGTVRIAEDVTLTSGSTGTVQLHRPVTLDADLTIATRSYVLKGMAGPGDLTIEGDAYLLGDLGTTTAPLGALSATAPVTLFGTVRTSAAQTYGAGLKLDGTSTVRSGGAGITVQGGASGGHPLSAVSPTAVTFAGGSVDVGALSVTAPAITPPASVTTGDAQTYTGTTHLAGATTLTTNGSGAVSVLGALQPAPGASLTLGGAGTTRLTGASTAAFPLTVSGGRTQVETVLPGTPVTVASGGTLGGTGEVGAVTATGGTIDPGTLAGSAPVRGTLTVGALTLNAASTVRIDALPGENLLDRLAVRGSAALGSATLSVPSLFGARIVPDTAVPLLDLLGGGSAIGTFAGLADGAPVTVGGVGVPLRYGAGDGNDVALVRTRRVPVLALHTAARVSTPCTPVTFTVVVAPSTATGTITFRDGDRVLGSAPLVDGVAWLSTSDLAPGTHAIVAAYGGDDFVRPATSVALAHGAGGEPDEAPLVPGGGGGIAANAAGCGVVRTAPEGPRPGVPTTTAAPAAPAAPATSRSSTAARAAATVAGPTRVRVRGTRLTFRQRFPRAGRVTWRVTRGGRTIATRTATVKPGTRTVTLTLPRGKGRLVLHTAVDGVAARAVTVTRR